MNENVNKPHEADSYTDSCKRAKASQNRACDYVIVAGNMAKCSMGKKVSYKTQSMM